MPTYYTMTFKEGGVHREIPFDKKVISDEEAIQKYRDLKRSLAAINKADWRLFAWADGKTRMIAANEA